MELIFNVDYELVYQAPDDDKLFFQNKKNETLIQLSRDEFEILQMYSESKSIQSVHEHYSKLFDFDSGFILELVKRAESINLLINKNNTQETSDKKRYRLTKIEPIIEYLATKFYSIFIRYGLELKIDFKGNFNFYKIFAIDFSKSSFSKLIYKANIYFIYGYSLLFILSIILMLMLWSDRPSMNDLMSASAPEGILVFLFILGGIIITTFFHELGHYILYSKFGGKTSKMGAAIMIGFLPVLYVSTNSLYLWTSKSKRLLVAVAGILVDILLLIITIDILLLYFPNHLTFYIIFFLVLFLTRILANANPFIPGTDGYFIFADIIDIPSLYQTASFNTHKFARNMATFQPSLVDKNQIASVLYLSISVLCITCYYLLIGAFILLPFAVHFFY